MVGKKDAEVLRKLASEYMELASDPINKEKIELWKALNRGEMQRPMVTIDQLPINELNVNGELSCVVEDQFWRGIESGLRLQIYKWKHFPADMVLDPFVEVPLAVTTTMFGVYEMPDNAVKTDAENDITSRHFINQFEHEEDIEKIQDLNVTHNEKLSKEWFDEAKIIFDGVVPVRQRGSTYVHLGLWDLITSWMGVENIYFDLIDRPEFMHTLMRKLTDISVKNIKKVNKLGIFDTNSTLCHCSHIFTDEMLPDTGKGLEANSKNGWNFGLAQLFSSVSPETFEEFELPYITELAREYGAIYYGCCDRLDDKLELVKKIPNVRKVSCSPWSNRKNFAENIGTKLVMSCKPNPAFVATDTFHEDIVREDIRNTIDLAKSNGVNLEFILKDISTVLYEPERLEKWEKIVMEEVKR